MKHTWNKTQIKALKSSILHWERMRDDKRRKFEGRIEEPYDNDCDCCKEYLYRDCLCDGCPIGLFAESDGCENTPYEAAVIAYNEYDIGSPQFKDAAQIQINFMNQVLKAGTNA